MRSLVNSVAIDSYDYGKLSIAVTALMAPLGGFERFVSPGMMVLINPNLLSARTPDRAITTHPALVRFVASECARLGAARVLIGDSPGGVAKGLKRVWDNTGMTEAAKLSGVELVGFESGDVKSVAVNGNNYHVSNYAFEADLIISLPKLKTHVLTNFTGAIKNCYGFIPGIRKSDYHKKHPDAKSFSNVIVDVFSIIKPGLFIMDGGLALEGDGPASGDPRWLGYLFASTDGVALDSSAMSLLYKGAKKIWPTEIAAGRKLGTGGLSDIERSGPAFENRPPANFKMPTNFYLNLIPSFLVRAVEPYLWARPAMNDDTCTMCEVCKDNCPQNAIFEKNGNMRINYDECIKCMCCHELCPENSVFLNKSRLAKFIG